MNYIKKWAYLPLITLCLFAQISCSNGSPGGVGTGGGSDSTAYVIQSPVTQRVVDSTSLISQVISDTLMQISDGVKETDIYYINYEGKKMHVYVLRVDLNKPFIKLESGLPFGATTLTGKMQPLPGIVKYYDSTGHHVVGAVNSEFFNRKTGIPRGVTVVNGKTLKDTWDLKRGQTFMAVLKNGKTVIGGARQDFFSLQGQIEKAQGAGQLLVKNHKLLSDIPVFTKVAPRTGAGLTDKDILYFVVADGRNAIWSNGLTIPDLGTFLRACGADIAINMDGGGSSTFMVRNPETQELQVRNRPSDGDNRPLGIGWLVISAKR